MIDSLATTTALAELFSDHSILQAMLAFEAALARAAAHCNVIPQSTAEIICESAKAEHFDSAAIARETHLSATPAVPLVNALKEHVRSQDPAASEYVHWGATSQDICDTAIILLLQRAQPILDADLLRLEKALRRLAKNHGGAVMLGRTLLQAAGPITFGLKAAGWLGAVHRGRQRLNAAFAESLLLQFGGASGTLAALGDKGIAVGEKLAAELGLKYPDAPWHTHRDRLATLLCACGVLSGSLSKMARDISLLAQNEIGEAAESTDGGRGGSSSMPHKRNPVGCIEVLAAANRIPALVSSFLSSMAQEHERAAGGWQAEWPIISGVIQGIGLAAAALAEVAEGLSVDEARMRANIEATRGAVFAERAVVLLAAKIGPDRARKLVEEAVRESLAQKRHLSEMEQIKQHLDPATLRKLEDPEEYLGVADEFLERLLDSARDNSSSNNSRSKE